MDSTRREWMRNVWAAGAAGDHPGWADLAWYAVDGSGRVGLFTSAGPGPVPRAMFRDLDAYLTLGEHLCALPVLGKPELLIRYPRPDDFRDAAARGLFAFNFVGGSPPAGGYRLVARPSVVLAVDTLPEWVRGMLGEVCFTRESFAATADRAVDLSGIRSQML